MAEDKKRCGAKCRDGSPCQNFAMDNGRCRMHGGASPKGNTSPHWESGLYSKYAGDSLKDVLAKLENIDSEELINADHELKLLQALIIESNILKENTGDLDDLEQISRVIERLVKSKQRATALKIEEQRLIPAEDIERLLSWMETIIIRKVGQEQGYEIMQELKSFKLSDHAN